MVEILVSSFSDRSADDSDSNSDNNDSSSGTSVSSRDSGSTNELYSSRVPRISLEVLQEEMRKRAVSRSSIGLLSVHYLSKYSFVHSIFFLSGGRSNGMLCCECVVHNRCREVT